MINEALYFWNSLEYTILKQNNINYQLFGNRKLTLIDCQI